jgi:hypothetical protein
VMVASVDSCAQSRVGFSLTGMTVRNQR